MRARAGDPPRTMTQKILAGRAEDPSLSSDLLRVKIDQVVLSREPERALSEALLADSRLCALLRVSAAQIPHPGMSNKHVHSVNRREHHPG